MALPSINIPPLVLNTTSLEGAFDSLARAFVHMFVTMLVGVVVTSVGVFIRYTAEVQRRAIAVQNVAEARTANQLRERYTPRATREHSSEEVHAPTAPPSPRNQEQNK